MWRGEKNDRREAASLLLCAPVQGRLPVHGLYHGRRAESVGA